MFDLKFLQNRFFDGYYVRTLESGPLLGVVHFREIEDFFLEKFGKSPQNTEKNRVKNTFSFFMGKAIKMPCFPKNMCFERSKGNLRNFFELGGPLSRVCFTIEPTWITDIPLDGNHNIKAIKQTRFSFHFAPERSGIEPFVQEFTSLPKKGGFRVENIRDEFPIER